MPMHTGGSLTGESPAAFRSLSTALERLLVSLVQVAMSLSPNDAKQSRIASTCLWIVCQLSPIVRAISLIDWPALGLMDRIGWIRGEWHSRKDNLLLANLLSQTHVFNIDPNYPHSVGMFVAHRVAAPRPLTQ